MSLAAPPAPRGTLPFLVKHHMSHGLPRARVEIPPVPALTTADLKLAERLMNVYDRAVQHEAGMTSKPSQDVWEMIGNEFHGEFLDALRTRQTHQLAKILNAAFRHDISHGLGYGVFVYNAAQTPEGNASIAALTIDRLASLAEALAALPYENPEQGRWGENIYIPPDELLDRIEQVIGISACPPNICGHFGVPMRGGYMFAQSCNQLYMAARIRQILDGSSWPRRVCEIGAGYGGTAYYAALLGFRDYRIFDLPVVNVLQGYYLIKALPECSVVLYGESANSPAVCVYPYWMFSDQPSKSFGIVVNQDSFPEINPQIVFGYLREIVRTTSCFLSINQEGQAPGCGPDGLQNLLPWMANQIPALRRVDRSPFWIRRGYVEEVYHCTDATPSAL